MTTAITATTTATPVAITPEALLEQWQGHRRLTRKVIETFPDDKLFTYSVGGMRPFSELALEMIYMASPGVEGAATGKWVGFDSLGHHGPDSPKPTTKTALLAYWDETTGIIDDTWSQFPAGRFQEIDKFFNAYDCPVYSGVLYLIDNEIHHRAQGYVYLRSLGIEPPAFWDRY